MQYFQDVLTLTTTAATLWNTLDLVGFDDAKITADDAVVKGVAKHPATETGMDIGVIALGTARVKASGIVTAGARVISAATGGVKTVGAGVNPFATALTSAADGEFVTILIR